VRLVLVALLLSTACRRTCTEIALTVKSAPAVPPGQSNPVQFPPAQAQAQAQPASDQAAAASFTGAPPSAYIAEEVIAFGSPGERRVIEKTFVQ